MQSVLLHVHPDAGQESRLQVALDLVRTFDGHLQCVEAVPFPLYVSDGFSGGMDARILDAELNEAMDSLREEQREAMQLRLRGEGVSWDWICRQGNSADHLLRQARLADVVVLSITPRAERYQDPLPLADRVAVRSRTPVLAVPQSCTSLKVAGCALVAWDGSTEAALALRESLPMLAAAASVHVAMVAEEEVGLPSEEPALYLSRHGIKCELHQCRLEGSVAETLQKLARGLAADLLVMGAYGRSRIREFLFGGVTRAMLHRSSRPLVLAH